MFHKNLNCVFQRGRQIEKHKIVDKRNAPKSPSSKSHRTSCTRSMSRPRRVYATPEINKAKAGKNDIADKNSDDDYADKENKNPNQAVEQNSLTLFLEASFKTPRNKKTLLFSIIVSDNDKVEDESPASENKYKRRRCDCGMSGHVSVKECDLCSKTKKKLEFH